MPFQSGQSNWTDPYSNSVFLLLKPLATACHPISAAGRADVRPHGGFWPCPQNTFPAKNRLKPDQPNRIENVFQHQKQNGTGQGGVEVASSEILAQRFAHVQTVQTGPGEFRIKHQRIDACRSTWRNVEPKRLEDRQQETHLTNTRGSKVQQLESSRWATCVSAFKCCR